MAPLCESPITFEEACSLIEAGLEYVTGEYDGSDKISKVRLTKFSVVQ